MCVVMIGIGYVGFVFGVCFVDFGYDVICVDKDVLKVEILQFGGILIYELGFDFLVQCSVCEGCFYFM